MKGKCVICQTMLTTRAEILLHYLIKHQGNLSFLPDDEIEKCILQEDKDR